MDRSIKGGEVALSPADWAVMIFDNNVITTAEVEAIEAAAAEAGVSRSRWIAEALARALTRPDVGVIAAPSTSSAGPVRVTVEASQAA